MIEEKVNMHSPRTGSAITVRVKAGAARTEILNILDDGTLLIALAVAKLGKKADNALIDYLALILAVEHDKVEIVAGFSGPDKIITISDIDTISVQAKIVQCVEQSK